MKIIHDGNIHANFQPLGTIVCGECAEENSISVGGDCWAKLENDEELMLCILSDHTDRWEVYKSPENYNAWKRA